MQDTLVDRWADAVACPFIMWPMACAFKTIALIGKYKSPEIAEPLLRLSSFLQSRGVRVLVDPLTAAHVGATIIWKSCRWRKPAGRPIWRS